MKETGYSLDDTRGINSEDMQQIRARNERCDDESSHLALEVFHDIQKPVVHLRLFIELNFDCIEVTQRISHIQCTTHLRRRLGTRSADR